LNVNQTSGASGQRRCEMVEAVGKNGGCATLTDVIIREGG
jgi:hypothetical protein